MYFNFISLFNLSDIIIIVIGSYLLFLALKNIVNSSNIIKLATLFLISTSIYIVTNNILDSLVFNNELALFVAKLSFFSFCLMPISLNFFLIQTYKEKYKITEFFFFFLNLLLSAYISFHSENIIGIDSTRNPVSLIKGNYYYLYILLVIVNVIQVIINLYKSIQKNSKTNQYLLKQIFLVINITISIIPITNLILPLLGITYFVKISNYVILWLEYTIYNYSINKKEIIDNKYILEKFFEYLLKSSIILFTYLVFYFLIDYQNIYISLQERINLGILVSILIVILFELIIDKVIRKKSNIDIESKFIEDIQKFKDINELKEYLKEKLTNIFNCKIQIIDSVENPIYEEIKKLGLLIPNYYSNLNKIILFENNYPKVSNIEKFIMKTKIEFIIFIINQDIKETQLLILLEGKNDNEIYNLNDEKIVQKLIPLIKIGLSKIEILQRTIEFNTFLKRKIKQATIKLNKQNKIIKKQLQLEKDMIGIMGHELRTPLTIARTSAELLLQILKSSGQIEKNYLIEKINKIHMAIQKEAELVQTLLSTSHIDNAKVNLVPEEYSLIEQVEFTIDMYKMEADRKNLYIKLENNLLNPIIFNDKNRMQEILSNLISNAVKYTNKGGITIQLKEENHYIIISVIDTGVGIPKDKIKNIGKRFFRVNQYSNNITNNNVIRAGGTGLGMFVVKGLLKSMGGKLKIESELGVGSKFTAYVPRRIKTFIGIETQNLNYFSPEKKN